MKRHCIVYALYALLSLLWTPVVHAAPAGLVAAYSFDEGSGTVLVDTSGNNNHGVVTGAAWTTGRYGNALAFNGIDNWVTVSAAPSLDVSNGMTLEAWVAPASVSGWQTVVLKEQPGQLAYALYASGDVGRPSGFVFTTSGVGTVGPAALPVNRWSHLAATYDGSTLSLYVDGVLASSQPMTGDLVVSASPLRLGGNSVWGEYFQGAIDEVRIYNRALSQAEIQGDMNTPVDATPPSVAVTAPLPGSTVSGAVTLSAVASDDVAVAGVQFFVDGAPLGGEVTTGPYAAAWTTTSVPDGTHSLTAVARDAAGNTTTSAAVMVTVANATDPTQVGQWAGPYSWPLVAVHSILLNTGKVLVWADGASAREWDPATGGFAAAANGSSDLFCAGHATGADGAPMVIGGHATSFGLGIRDAYRFDPAVGSWSPKAPMRFPRWYPTATTLPDGRILVTSGADSCVTCYVQTPEVYDPRTNVWTPLLGATRDIPSYPFMFVLPDGRVIHVGGSEYPTATEVLDVAAQSWTTVDPRVIDGGSAAMYRSGFIMKSGSAADSGMSGAAVDTTYVLDTSQASPAWRQTASMAFPRAFHNLTLLPDGNVLVTGGGRMKDGMDVSKAVKEAEMWSPVTETWATMAAMQTPRLYHSTALLLPDGRVLVAGSGQDAGVPDQLSAEIYSPPYLFRGARPALSSAPPSLRYGATFTVQTPDASSIVSVSLVRTGAVTHAFNMDQRFLSLAFQQVPGGVSVTAPSDGNLAPPGNYLLFVVNNDGVPSIGSLMNIPLQ